MIQRRRPGKKKKRGAKGASGGFALLREPKPKKYASRVRQSRAPAREALEHAVLERTRHLFEGMVTNAPDNLLAVALSEHSPIATMTRVLSDLATSPIGITPDDLALAAARARGAFRKQRLLEQAGGAVTGSELADLLDISRQAVSEGRNSHLYFGLPLGDRYVYPKFQLTESGTLPGLREFLSAFPIQDAWAQLLLLLSPSPRLGKRTPLDALKHGDIKDAVGVAARYGEHGG